MAGNFSELSRIAKVRIFSTCLQRHYRLRLWLCLWILRVSYRVDRRYGCLLNRVSEPGIWLEPKPSLWPGSTLIICLIILFLLLSWPTIPLNGKGGDLVDYGIFVHWKYFFFNSLNLSLLMKFVLESNTHKEKYAEICLPIFLTLTT